jgi:CubicO group peptidase (beta-lactamase class C family)
MKLVFLLISLIAPGMSFSQADDSSQLFNVLKARDSLLFNVGFNTCDIQQFEKLVSDNFEFYHDQAGITNSKAAFIAGIKDGLCKLPYKPQRRLMEHSLEVYPLKKNGLLYGAIQTGVHQFYAVEGDGPPYLTSTAKFTHVWLLESGQWNLSRGLSYDHKEADKPVNESLLFKDRRETEKWLAAKRIPALGIGYIKDGKIKEVTVYGKNEKGEPHPANTIFNVASLTKPITAMVALKLVNAGKWSLDEPVYKHWTDPDIAADARHKKLTTRHILSHQSGFPNWRSKTGGKLVFEFEPGTRYQYSGEGYEYLRLAMEHKFGKPLEQLAQELIFTPLNMTETRFYWDDKMDESRFAKWHKGDGTLHKTYKNKSANAADDLLTTVEDYCKFMVHVMNGAGLKNNLYKQMVSEQMRIKPRKYFGLGWWVDENVNGENALLHGGDDIGVHTMVFILPKSKQALLIFTNCDNGTDIYIPTVQHYLGKTGEEIIEVETR